MSNHDPHVRTFVEQAVTLVMQQETRAAEERFVRAVTLVDRMTSPDDRRHNYGRLGVVLIRSGFAALAARVASEAIQLHEQARDDKGIIASLLTFGTAMSRLGHADRALKAFTRARDLAVSLRDLHDAAAASTNFGATLIKLGRVKEALPHLDQSIEWLKGRAFPDAEIETRLNLLSAYDALGEPTQRCFDLARDTLDRFDADVNAWRYRKMLSQRLARTVKRHRAAHGSDSEIGWVFERFPELQHVQ